MTGIEARMGERRRPRAIVSMRRGMIRLVDMVCMWRCIVRRDAYERVLRAEKNKDNRVRRRCIEEEIKEAEDKPEKLEKEIKLMLLPKDSADDGSAYLEIRAGAGGDEASIFAGDLFRMY